MKQSLLVSFLLTIFFFSAFFLFSLQNSFGALQNSPEGKFLVSSKNEISSPINNYFANLQTKVKVSAASGVGDSRPIIVDNFLASHHSPMTGLGNAFVQTADKYNLDWRLLPAIAFQESTLGKYMPQGSHNAFGWAIYTGQDSGAKFHNWEFAIDTVAAGLKKDYIDKGLTSVNAIMTRYTPDSNGDWASGVNFAIQQMSIN